MPTAIPRYNAVHNIGEGHNVSPDRPPCFLLTT